ncbi:hypothetical protein [Flaviaesturariibacter flavus]|uniref:hypothetical protein n=1 Tax=Flaviaesturariibacter flavus TaxID=2502780 RepID=UPI00140480F7|nr:hypothetical protein [Flaviaesturariibacter flavus]
MKKYMLIALAGLFAAGTVFATVNGEKDKGKKKKQGCCQKMEKSACKKDMKSCAKM